jgi:hypothetical protein
VYRDKDLDPKIQTKLFARVMNMNKKLLVSVIAFAGMALAAGKSYTVTLYGPAMVGTTELKAGEYRVEVDNDKAVIKAGKLSKEATVKVEAVDSKFTSTSVRLGAGEKPQIQEIRLGGTNTKLVFNGNSSAAGM